MTIAISGKAVFPDRVIDDALILVEGEKITYAGEKSSAPELPQGTSLIEHAGLILPGLVDIHNHGGGGWSFPDTEEPSQATPAIMEHRKHGTTSLVASLVTASQETLLNRVHALSQLVDAGELAGIHLEGPFISEERKGAHDPQFIAPADSDRVRELLEAGRGTIVTMTVAPEIDADGEVTKALIEGGALPSYGHTDCSGSQMIHAVDHALDVIENNGEKGRSSRPTSTHLFNAMRPIHHRDAGPAYAAIDASSRGTLVSELIADGVHTAADTVKYTFDLIPDGSIMLITDSMAAAGMADGDYVLGSLAVTVKDGVATLTEGGAIAGGTAHLLDVVRFAHLDAGVDLVRAVTAATSTPASVIGIHDVVGSLESGKLANLVLVSPGLEAEKVLFKGEWLGE